MVRALLLLLALVSFPALAQDEEPSSPQKRCAKMEDIQKGLKQSANETATFASTLGQGALVVFTSPEQTYTLIFLRPDGIGCVLAAGEAWHELPKRTPQPKTQESGEQ